MTNSINHTALNSLIRIGRIVEVDPDKALARVQWGENETCVTDWIRWTTERAGAVKVWNPPTIGEEVELISPNGDMRNAYIGRSFFNADNPAPSTNIKHIVITYDDGTEVKHDRENAKQTITGLKTLDATITSTKQKGTLDWTGNTQTLGNHNAIGKIDVLGAISAAGLIT